MPPTADRVANDTIEKISDGYFGSDLNEKPFLQLSSTLQWFRFSNMCHQCRIVLILHTSLCEFFFFFVDRFFFFVLFLTFSHLFYKHKKKMCYLHWLTESYTQNPLLTCELRMLTKRKRKKRERGRSMKRWKKQKIPSEQNVWTTVQHRSTSGFVYL